MTDLNYEHFSHSFAMNLKKLPVKVTDRHSRLILTAGVLFGAMLCLLSLFYFMPDSLTGAVDIENSMPKSKNHIETLISPEIFNVIIFLTGLGLILWCFVKFLGYKKIFFDGTCFTVKAHPLGGSKEVFKENLYNYLGVRLRVKFYQFGIFTLNKYIVELYHRDPDKIIPLYISLRKKNIRKIWQNYAKTLHMPGITMSEKGMVSHNAKDMDLPYAEVVSKWHLPKNFAYQMEKPYYMVFKSRKTGEKMIKISKLFLDAYSFLSICTVSILGALLVFAALNYEVLLLNLSIAAVWSFYALLGIIILYALLQLFSKDIIFIAHDKVWLFRKIGFMRLREAVIPVADIKGIEINYTPLYERYFILLSTSGKSYRVGNKLPVEGLRWLRAVLINEIIGN